MLLGPRALLSFIVFIFSSILFSFVDLMNKEFFVGFAK